MYNIIYDGFDYSFRTCFSKIKLIISSLILVAWQCLGAILIGLCLVFPVNFLLDYITRFLFDTTIFFYSLEVLLYCLKIPLLSVFGYFFTGYANMALCVVDEKENLLVKMFIPIRMASKGALIFCIPFLIDSYLLNLLPKVGLSALVILTSFIWFRISFSIFYLVDKDLGIVDSLNQSWEMTYGYWWFFYSLLYAFSAILGSFSGLIRLASYFIFLFANAYIYRQLSR